MIASLTGILKAKSPTEILLDVNGVGYAIHIPLTTYQSVGEVGAQLTLLTHLIVREDALVLFGFSTAAERETFRLLLTINGIGPRTAQGILSGIGVEELKKAIAAGDVETLTTIPSVGRKTAERLIIELRDKIGRLTPTSAPLSPTTLKIEQVRLEALLALTSLGLPRPTAEKSLRSILNEPEGPSLSVEELIKRALRHSSAK